uniref:F-box domain-containing protein n=1 Tax=Meloidogyne incognita TaxID=6306 RepID=A0A914N239_MELIC
MNSLPPEVQLDILKCVNFDQLVSVKQTNRYFNNFIDGYENELARLKFYKLNIIIDSNINQSNIYEIIPLESVISEFILNDQLKEKWQEAIAKSIPLYLQDYEERNLFAVELDKIYFDLKKKKIRHYILKLPNFPKNIKEMSIVRCWLERLFNCFFEYTDFKNLFNPEMINLLFDDDKSIPLQFLIQKPSLSVSSLSYRLDNTLKFVLNHLSISESLSIDFNENNISEQQIDILFNILTKEGNKLSQFCLKSYRCFEMSRLYELIFEHITTSKNCSKLVPVIMLEYISELNFEVNKEAENVEIKEFNGVKYTKYKITNKHDPNLKFSFCNAEFKGNTDFIFKIRIMKM